MLVSAYLMVSLRLFYSNLFKPAVSVGNVGQLSTDLLIAALKPERIGYIYHESLLAVVGNDPYTDIPYSCKLCTCCDGTV